MRIFVATLLCLELTSLAAPELSVLHTPELLALYKTYPVLPRGVPELVRVLLPGLDSNAALWSNIFACMRIVLICFWGAFLALPYNAIVPSGVLYAVGAVLYFILGSIGLQYNLGHSSQAALLFVLVAALACGDLERPRSSAWLRKFLMHGVLAPMYLCAGLAKLRWVGILGMLNGQWIAATLEPNARTAFPALNSWLISLPGAMPLLSVGNFMVELILPIGVLLLTGSATRTKIVEGALLMLCFVFHTMIFLLIGPNFIRLDLLLFVAAEPLLCSGLTQWRQGLDDALALSRDHVRGIVTQLIVLVWFFIQFRADLVHMLGIYNWDEESDPFWPIPELSMFQVKVGSAASYTFRAAGKANHVYTLTLTAVILFSYLYTQLFDVAKTLLSGDAKDKS